MSFKLASELFGKSSPASGKTIEDGWGHCPLSLSLSLSLSRRVPKSRSDSRHLTTQLLSAESNSVRDVVRLPVFACPLSNTEWNTWFGQLENGVLREGPRTCVLGYVTLTYRLTLLLRKQPSIHRSRWPSFNHSKSLIMMTLSWHSDGILMALPTYWPLGIVPNKRQTLNMSIMRNVGEKRSQDTGYPQFQIHNNNRGGNISSSEQKQHHRRYRRYHRHQQNPHKRNWRGWKQHVEISSKGWKY